ncbi:hypothetical protein, partial [Streptococcus pneumoniae]|uniref:hypothetical protein n=1 Tax=Streptococcus pneumoniae TaxID=1313 RepID=UPI001D0C6176
IFTLISLIVSLSLKSYLKGTITGNFLLKVSFKPLKRPLNHVSSIENVHVIAPVIASEMTLERV